MDTKITVTIVADASRLNRALEQLAERVKSGDSALTDVDGARQALGKVLPSKLFPCYAPNSLLAHLVELAQRYEREEMEKLWREHVANLDTDPR